MVKDSENKRKRTSEKVDSAPQKKVLSPIQVQLIQNPNGPLPVIGTIALE